MTTPAEHITASMMNQIAITLAAGLAQSKCKE
jgi:hypothetical protein